MAIYGKALEKLENHNVHRSDKGKKGKGRYERLRMRYWVDDTLGNVKQQPSRVDQYVPSIPAQISAQINGKAAQQQNQPNQNMSIAAPDTLQ